jgi:hypothetical protein
VAVVQHGGRLQVRSMPGSRSRVLMDMTANGQVLTGTWTEETNPAGYHMPCMAPVVDLPPGLVELAFVT